MKDEGYNALSDIYRMVQKYGMAEDGVWGMYEEKFRLVASAEKEQRDRESLETDSNVSRPHRSLLDSDGFV